MSVKKQVLKQSADQSSTDNNLILPSLLTALGRRKEPMIVAELASVLRVSKRTIYNLIEQPENGLPCIKVGTVVRLEPQHVVKFLRGRTN